MTWPLAQRIIDGSVLPRMKGQAAMSTYKLKWIDNTRLTAVLGVLSFHFWLSFGPEKTTISNLLSGWWDVLLLPVKLGWEADFLFFVVSGLGLSLSMVNRPKKWSRFFFDRAGKIYIPYWVALVLMMAYQGVAYSINTWDRLFVIPDTAWGWLKNVLLVPQPPIALLSTHFWFLPSLLVLYAAFPFVFKLIDKFGTKAFVPCLIAATFAYKMPLPLGPFSVAYAAFAWSPSFVIGVYLGIALGKNPERVDAWLIRTIPLGMICLVGGTVAVLNDGWSWLAHPLLGFGTLSVVGAFGRLPWHFPRLTSFSFEIYLVHMPFVGWYRHFFGFVTEPKILIYPFYLVSVGIMGAAVHWVVKAIDTQLFAGTKKQRPVEHIGIESVHSGAQAASSIVSAE